MRRLEYAQMIVSGDPEGTPDTIKFVYDVADEGGKQRFDQVHKVNKPDFGHSLERVWRREMAKIKANEKVP